MQRLSACRSESGFTLIEILVVMIILGALAAIAIPAFFSQESKAKDTSAKVQARTMATAIETCATEGDGNFDDCDRPRLTEIEPLIPADAQVPLHAGNSYVVQSGPAETTGNLFRIRKIAGNTTRECTVGPAGEAGSCNTGGQDAAPGVEGTW